MRKLQIQPYSKHLIVHENCEQNECQDCGYDASAMKEVQQGDLHWYDGKPKVWWTCMEYNRKGF